ncbi:Unknown protein [Striga hermonthica]|uniref:F-box domain-containing protein n=1 Tax=Striga hermonthica TaxID=68872 RepID=A0A9N7P3P3_STRHE|nr:Unknown protein [Striga hermonthica]
MRPRLPKFDIPPPRRRPGKEELNTEEVAPFKFLVPPVDQTIRTFYPRRCKRKRVTSDIESLPDELLFEVLVRIPGQDIYEARLVCRKWYHIIHTHNFMSAYLHHSPYGLLFKSKCSESLLVLPQRGRGGRIGIEMTQLRYKRRCLVFSSCNGLWLEKNLQSENDLYVTNPTTGQNFLLPPCVIHVADANHAMAYTPASMEYKVVIFCPPNKTFRPVCHILTAGVDKTWRDVDLGPISSEEASRSFRNPPLVTEGFVHWKHPRTHHLLTLNVETETITETPAPFPQLQDFPVHASRTDIYLSTGKYLSLLRPYGECSWQVWEMSRPETGEWKKKAHFSLEGNEERFKQLGFAPKEFLFPQGWVKYPELLAMRTSSKMTALLLYNLVTQEINEIGLPSYYFQYNFVVYKSSLEWLDAVKPPLPPSSPLPSSTGI